MWAFSESSPEEKKMLLAWTFVGLKSHRPNYSHLAVANIYGGNFFFKEHKYMIRVAKGGLYFTVFTRDLMAAILVLS